LKLFEKIRDFLGTSGEVRQDVADSPAAQAVGAFGATSARVAINASDSSDGVSVDDVILFWLDGRALIREERRSDRLGVHASPEPSVEDVRSK